jgi:DNA-binding response OmpR family regulator
MYKKIVVIDDDPVILDIVNVNFSKRGYQVVTVMSGKEALKIIRDIKPDIIILDVIMPDIDGWEVLKILKDAYTDFTSKIIMLTAKSSDRDKMIGRSILKADAYITKPFTITDLLTIVKNLLGDNDEFRNGQE